MARENLDVRSLLLSLRSPDLKVLPLFLKAKRIPAHLAVVVDGSNKADVDALDQKMQIYIMHTKIWGDNLNSAMTVVKEFVVICNQWLEGTPVKCVAEVKDLVGGVHYLASPLFNFTTGHDLVMDWGFILWLATILLLEPHEQLRWPSSSGNQRSGHIISRVLTRNNPFDEFTATRNFSLSSTCKPVTKAEIISPLLWNILQMNISESMLLRSCIILISYNYEATLLYLLSVEQHIVKLLSFFWKSYSFETHFRCLSPLEISQRLLVTEAACHLCDRGL